MAEQPNWISSIVNDLASGGARPRRNGTRPQQQSQPQHRRNQQSLVRRNLSSNPSSNTTSLRSNQASNRDDNGVDNVRFEEKQSERNQRTRTLKDHAKDAQEPDDADNVPLWEGDIDPFTGESNMGDPACGTQVNGSNGGTANMAASTGTGPPANPSSSPTDPFAGMHPSHVSQLTGTSINSAQQNQNNASSQPQQGGSLFGSTANNSQQQGGGGLFGGAAGQTTQPQQQQPQQQSGSLFGNTTNQQSQAQQQSGGLFGNTGGSSLFGNKNQPTQQPGSSSLFGGQQNQQQNTQQQGGGSLFGGGNSLFGGQQNQQQNNQQSNTTGGSLFGGGNSLFGGQQNQQKPMGSTFGTSNLFGGGNQNQNNQQNTGTSSLFGGNTQSQNQNHNQQQNNSNSLFGSLNKPPPPSNAPSLFAASQYNHSHFGGPLTGRLSMGQGNNAPTQTVSATKLDWTTVRGTTRFADLVDSANEDLEKVDRMIQTQEQLCKELESWFPGHGASVDSIKPDVDLITEKAGETEAALGSDAQAVQLHKDIVMKDEKDIARCERVILNNRLPEQYRFSSLAGYSTGYGTSRQLHTPAPTPGLDGEEGYDTDLIGNYFLPMASEMSRICNAYTSNLAEIEGHMKIIEGSAVAQAQQLAAKRAGVSGGQGAGDDTVRELADTLRGFEQSILGAASGVGQCREGVNNLVLGRLGGSESVNGYASTGGSMRRPW